MSVTTSNLPFLDVCKALAFVGDLGMGLPVDHSMRAASLARMLARVFGCSPVDVEAARQLALLRWAAYTEDAAPFPRVFTGEACDRAGAAASVSAARQAQRNAPSAGQALVNAMRVYCSVSARIGTLIGASPQVCQGLGMMFETFDGRGSPGILSGREIPISVHVARLSGDIEVFSRESGVDDAMSMISSQRNKRYAAALVDCALDNMRTWLDGLADRVELDAIREGDMQPGKTVSLELVADVIDLRTPGMTGYSARVARAVRACCEALALDVSRTSQACRAALIHGLGRASVPNAIWNATGHPSLAESERIRLAPYWTQRAAMQIPALRAEAELASYAFERANGTGYFRGESAGRMSIEAQVLALAVAWCDFQRCRSHLPGCSSDEACKRLLKQAAAGDFDAILATRFVAAMKDDKPLDRRTSRPLLSERELQVLLRISLGESSKQAALALNIGPGTVRTHVENILKKLECTTRAAAMLSATSLGLIQAGDRGSVAARGLRGPGPSTRTDRPLPN